MSCKVTDAAFLTFMRGAECGRDLTQPPPAPRLEPFLEWCAEELVKVDVLYQNRQLLNVSLQSADVTSLL